MRYNFLEVRAFETDVNPKGITPEVVIPAGEVIHDFSHLKRSPHNDSHSFQVSETEYMKDLEIISKVNHSCDPNLIVDTKAMVVKTIKEIRPGEIMTYFYPSTEWEMVSPFKCLCGSSQCLGTIQGVKHMSTEQIGRYFINEFVLKIRSSHL